MASSVTVEASIGGNADVVAVRKVALVERWTDVAAFFADENAISNVGKATEAAICCVQLETAGYEFELSCQVSGPAGSVTCPDALAVFINRRNFIVNAVQFQPSMDARVSVEGGLHRVLLVFRPAESANEAVKVSLALTGNSNELAHMLSGLWLKPAGGVQATGLRRARTTRRTVSVPITVESAIDKAVRLEKERRYWEALSEISQDDGMAGPAGRVKMRLWHRVRAYEEICKLYAVLPEKEKWEHTHLVPWLEACANLRRADDIRATLDRLAVNYEPGLVSGASLLRAFSFAGVGRGTTRELLRDILLDNLEDKRLSFNGLLHFGHLCLADSHWSGFSKARGVLQRRSRDAQEKAKVDILNAQLAFVLNDPEGQEEQINRALHRFDLSPVRRVDPMQPLSVANLAGEPAESSQGHNGPLVSVIMTTFNRQKTVRYAAASILNQTWKNIELLVVDDASVDDTREVLEEMRMQDSRIRFSCMPENVGTYCAKNHALAQARGEFVVCQDSDDWAHPRKVETEATHLVQNPGAVGVTIQQIRLNEEKGIKSRIGYLKKDFSSFMFRRQPVLAEAGYFDSVRVGADAELQLRAAKVFGSNALVDLPDLLSFVSWADDTLTGGGDYGVDDELGVMSERRAAYRRAFLQWHQQTSKPFVAFPMVTRPFDV